MKKGFWTHVQEIAPSLPDVGTWQGSWRITPAALRAELVARQLPISEAMMQDLLLHTEDHCPGFPWQVTQAQGDLIFSPALPAVPEAGA